MGKLDIGTWQYVGVDQLKRFVVPDGCTQIGDGAFASSALEFISIAPTVRKIGKDAFSNLRFLREIVIPEGVVEIGDMAFNSCVWLRRVVFRKRMVKAMLCRCCCHSPFK